ncbi:glycosyltransferase [Kineosporia sp. NBRC 101731]|uniref:glycosyltransferase n=1 Tax=Kineosporia sp. NBRC 101731 TaxID=3032199 RepID=UPI0024A52A08|nr:glycosyltransferase [Kineosporia sp. NBRC 101731]GLY33177.1 glycosyl transferase [Kineosporia sp. NBRC 101731]
MKPEAFAVVIPAMNEADLVGDCLDAVIAAVSRNRLPVAIVLVAHHCTDNTETVARERFSKLNGLIEGMVVRLDRGNVATARSIGTMAGLCLLAAYGVSFDRTWLLSTDADSRVPADWIDRYRRHMNRRSAALTGLVQVTGWDDADTQDDAREAYHHLLRTTGPHAYAANLAVRADAYLDVGGWPDQVPGEEHALLEALRRNDWPVVPAPDNVVTTSGRDTPRAPGGLGELLGRLRAAHAGVPRQALRSRP